MNDEIAVQRTGFKISRKEIRAVLKTLREHAPWKFPAGTLSIAFVDDAKTCELHETFLNDPTKTDVITFPGDEVFTVPVRRNFLDEKHLSRGANTDDIFAGEIVICVDQAMRAAKQFGTVPADEILLYLVHGWLHLAGLDDLADDTRAQMRAAETEAIGILRSRGVAPISCAFPQPKTQP